MKKAKKSAPKRKATTKTKRRTSVAAKKSAPKKKAAKKKARKR
jgi:hypothetical protein